VSKRIHKEPYSNLDYSTITNIQWYLKTYIEGVQSVHGIKTKNTLSRYDIYILKTLSLLM